VKPFFKERYTIWLNAEREMVGEDNDHGKRKLRNEAWNGLVKWE